MIVDVILLNTTSSLDMAFSYSVLNESDIKDIKIGMRVLVPFGFKNSLKEGIIVSINNDSLYELKSISKLLVNQTVVGLDLLNMLKFAREYYVEPTSRFFDIAIPNGAKMNLINQRRNIKEGKTQVNYLLNKNVNNDVVLDIYNSGFKNNKRIKELIDALFIDKYITVNQTKANSRIIQFLDLLIEKDIVLKKNQVTYRESEYKNLSGIIKREINLTDEQEYCFNEINKTIKENIHSSYLLHGVTGSGKTEIFIELISELIMNGKNALILVPEINLIPQMVKRMESTFGNIVGIYHSKLSQGQRSDEWFRIANNEYRIVIGARSGIFVPLKNIGIIIVDEEHENSYKSDTSPRYDARVLAINRGEFLQIPVIFSSATPSMELYKKSRDNEVKYLRLSNRYSNANKKISIVDMKEELLGGNKSILSNNLKEKISNNLLNKNMTLLFINKKGYSSFVSCRECGYAMKCPHCDISLTYHKFNNKVECRLCGFSQIQPLYCPSCSSKYFKHFGIGTEKAEELIKKEFPDARIIRVDSISMRNNSMPVKLFKDIEQGMYDIIIGTQIMAKGHDFKNLSLVGVLSSDIDLYVPNYNASERAFQLLAQVTGRSGRGNDEANIVIQGYNIDHYAVTRVIEEDYDGFYNDEIEIRKLFKYPPIYNQINVIFSGENKEKINDFANNFNDFLNNLEIKDDIIIIGPSPLINEKINNKYRFNILIKYINGDTSIKESIREYRYLKSTQKLLKDVQMIYDIDPINII